MTAGVQKQRTAGDRAYEREDYEAAAQAYGLAAQSLREAGEPLSAAEIENNRSVALLQAGDPQAALEAVEGTADLFAQAGDRRRQALALGNQAAALQALKRYEEAEHAYRLSAGLLAELGENELRASVMRAISELQLRTGRQLEAVASMHSGLEGIERPGVKQRLVKRLLEMPFKFLSRS